MEKKEGYIKGLPLIKGCDLGDIPAQGFEEDEAYLNDLKGMKFYIGFPKDQKRRKARHDEFIGCILVGVTKAKAGEWRGEFVYEDDQTGDAKFKKLSCFHHDMFLSIYNYNLFKHLLCSYCAIEILKLEIYTLMSI